MKKLIIVILVFLCILIPVSTLASDEETPIEWDSLTYKVSTDNGFVQCFYQGLVNVRAPLSMIGYTENPINCAENLVWNIWKSYVDNINSKDRYSKASYKIVKNRWTQITQSSSVDANDYFYRAFMDLKNAGKFDISKASLNSKQDHCKNVFNMIESIMYSDRDDYFIIIEIGGYPCELSPTGQTKFVLVEAVEGDYMAFKDVVTGKSTTIRFKEDWEYITESPRGNTWGFTNSYAYFYTPDIKEETPEPEPEKPKKDRKTTYESLDIQKIAIDIKGFDGTARFVWASDLHIIGNESQATKDRYAIIDPINKKSWDGRDLLVQIANYAEEQGVTLILGGDICDYASVATYSAVQYALEDRSNPIHYIAADHDVLPGPGPNDLGDNIKAVYYSLPGAFDNKWVKDISINGLNAYLINMSTEKGLYDHYLNLEQGIVFTHVPFDFDNHAIANHSYSVRQKYYAWSDIEGSVYPYSSTNRMKTYRNDIVRNQIGAIFSGHVHVPSAFCADIGNDFTKEYMLKGAYTGTIYDITIK